MRKIIFWGLALNFGFICAAFGQASGVSAPPKVSHPKTIEIDLEGGVGITTDRSITGTFSGPAGGGAIYYYLNPRVRIGLSASYFSYDHNYYTLQPAYDYTLKISFLNFLAVGKYNFGGDEIRPYVLAGAGTSIYSISTRVGIKHYSPGGTLTSETPISEGIVSASYPVLEAGLGIECVLTDDLNLFVQGRYDQILVSNGSLFMAPIEGGLNFSF